MNTSQNNRFNLQPETLQDLQESLYDWQNYNFGAQDNERVLLGMAEEAGELCHSHLKLEQGIRGTPEDHEVDMRDAVGDICIYMLNYMSGMGKKLPTFVSRDDVEKSDDLPMIRKSVLSVYRLVGKIVEEPQSMARIQHLTSGLLYLCALKGWCLDEVIRDTWKAIGPRDWKKYPENGFPPATPSPVDQNPTSPEGLVQPNP